MSNNYGPRIVTDGLVLCLDAADRNSYPGSGTSWGDLSGNGNNGSLVNGVGYNSENKGSLSFDGVNDYINCGADTSVRLTQKISVFCYVKASVQDNRWFVSKYKTDTNQRSWLIGFSNSSQGAGVGRLSAGVLDLGTSGSGRTLISSEYINNSNKWYYVGFTFDQGDFKIYIDGVISVPVYDTATNITTLYDSNAPITIGSLNTGAGFVNSKISQVSIYNRALSPSEILQNFKATKGRFGL